MRSTSTSSRGSSEASYKTADHRIVSVPWSDLDPEAVVDGRPWRSFPWYLGQKNYSGLYWCATERALVGYESRLERARLMMVDFDPTAKRIASQPFQLRARIDGQRITRVPDYLVCTDDGPLLIDVKPERALRDADVLRLLELTRSVVESRGWRYEIASEPPPVEFTNIRFLAGYRQGRLFDAQLLDAVKSSARQVSQPSIGEIVAHTQQPKPRALAALFHLLWRHECTIDISRRISAATTVQAM
jgi:hypothetical protein